MLIESSEYSTNCMRAVGVHSGGRTEQVQHVFISLHVVAVLVEAAAQHLVAAGEPALQPLWPGPAHGHCHMFWS